jgi:hypothetical protein
VRDSLVAQGNTVVGVDDAHLLDQLSATLLHQVAMDRAARIVATIRSGEPVPDAVTSLWKDSYLLRLELEPFTKAQSVRFIETVLGGQVEELSAEVMWETSGGNALFLRYLIEGAVDAGTLSEVNGVWQLRGGTVVTIGLAELLESRLAEAGPDALNALKLLALCEPLDIDVLSELWFPRFSGDFRIRFDLANQRKEVPWERGSIRSSCVSARCGCTGSRIRSR